MTDVTKTCPQCIPVVRLVERVNRATNAPFLGCPNWPGCTYTTEVPVDVQLRRLGAPELF